tara:strand:- start:1620 stop:2258 length:639 start_codon:yes stop_codon:yes gene_type:complete
MVIELSPEIGVPIPKPTQILDLKDRAAAASKTAELLHGHGAKMAADPMDEMIAAEILEEYAKSPEEASKKMSVSKHNQLTPASLVLVNSMLNEFGQSVVKNAVDIRNLVTNKLLLETDNPDPRIRIRALELLGKVSDVGLFADKTEITITHKSTAELRDQLRGKLRNLLYMDADAEDGVVLDGEVIDVEAELGLKHTILQDEVVAEELFDDA